MWNEQGGSPSGVLLNPNNCEKRHMKMRDKVELAIDHKCHQSLKTRERARYEIARLGKLGAASKVRKVDLSTVKLGNYMQEPMQ